MTNQEILKEAEKYAHSDEVDTSLRYSAIHVAIKAFMAGAKLAKNIPSNSPVGRSELLINFLKYYNSVHDDGNWEYSHLVNCYLKSINSQ